MKLHPHIQKQIDKYREIEDIELFRDTKDYNLSARFYECEQHFTIEELYQAFKTRLLSELNKGEL